MGVPLVNEDILKNYTETTELDISQLLFEKEPVSLDWPRNQIYISQSFEVLNNYFTLQGTLEAEDPAYELFFLKTKDMNNIKEMVKNGVPLTLIIKCGISYHKVPVIITTLPIMYLKIEVTVPEFIQS